MALKKCLSLFNSSYIHVQVCTCDHGHVTWPTVCQYKANNAVDTCQFLLTLADNSVVLTSPDAAPAAQPGQ